MSEKYNRNFIFLFIKRNNAKLNQTNLDEREANLSLY